MSLGSEVASLPRSAACFAEWKGTGMGAREGRGYSWTWGLLGEGLREQVSTTIGATVAVLV